MKKLVYATFLKPNGGFRTSYLPLVLFVLLALVQACSKDPDGEPIAASGNGLAAGECRFKTMADSAQFTYDNQNRITKLANYEYTYTANSVTLTDAKVNKSIMIFNLKANGYPANLTVQGLTDTIAQNLTWFVYNADSSLALSRSFIWVKDKYVYDGKQAYTWTNKNLTRIISYGKDSINALAVVNIAYDTSKLDKRKPIFEKFLPYVPNFAFFYMPKSASKHLPKDLQLVVTGGPTNYYQIYQFSDAKGNVLREAMRLQGGAEVLSKNYTYECKD
jgi:hypothetical protein